MRPGALLVLLASAGLPARAGALPAQEDPAAAAQAAAAEARKNPAAFAEVTRSAELGKEAAAALERQDYSRALEVAGEAVRINPGNAQAWNFRAIADVKLGRFEEAVHDSSYALALMPGNAPALQSRSWAYAKRGDFRRALEDASATLSRDPDNAFAMENRAFALAGLGDRPGALEALGRAATKDGRFSARYKQALEMPGNSDLLLLFGDQPEAGKAALDAGQSEKFRREAQNAMSTGDDRAAIEAASRAIAADPLNLVAYNLRAIAYQHLRDYPRELDDVNAGLKIGPGNSALLLSKATALNRLKRFPEALAAADAALAADPNSYYGYYMRAQALGGQGDRKGMIAALRKAVDRNPGYYNKLQEALGLPSAADTAFLFPEEKAAPHASAPAPPWGRSLGMLGALILIVGGLSGFGGFHLSRRSIRRTASRSAPGPSTPGLLRGQFRTLRQIGAGGMGLVYEGTDVSLDRRVAIKKMREEIRRDPRERERFITEAKLVAALHHPNIVDIYSIVEEGEDVYLVFEFISGKTVSELIGAKGRMDFTEALSVANGVASALDYAHGLRVIHRDLKPSNIMIDDRSQPKVMDFGVARQAKDALTKMTNTIVGTPPYMAPEQEQGHVRSESDVYSLAVCLYEMISGKLPFSGVGPAMHLNKAAKRFLPLSVTSFGLPQGIDAVFSRAFEPDPNERFPTASEFLASLARLS